MADEKVEPYRENENFVPDPTDVTSLVRTDGVTGQIEDVRNYSGVFDAAEARRRVVAAKALDPESPVDRGLVILPSDNAAPTDLAAADEEARNRVSDQAKAAIDEHPEVVTPDLRSGSDIAGEVGDDFRGADDNNDINAIGQPVRTRRPRTARPVTEETPEQVQSSEPVQNTEPQYVTPEPAPVV